MENKTEKENLLNYVSNNFNVNVTTIRLIDSIYSYFEDIYTSLNVITYKEKRIKINEFIYTIIHILNDANIDITIEELLDNNILHIYE